MYGSPCPFVVSLSNHERTYDTVSQGGGILKISFFFRQGEKSLAPIRNSPLIRRRPAGVRTCEPTVPTQLVFFGFGQNAPPRHKNPAPRRFYSSPHYFPYNRACSTLPISCSPSLRSL